MSTSISRKLTYVHSDGWRGYQEPVDAVAGANDTGSYYDSPCPTATRKAELAAYTKQLRQEGIKYRTMYCQTSNVFCIHVYIAVAAGDRKRALEIAREHKSNTRLFYPVEQPRDKEVA